MGLRWVAITELKSGTLPEHALLSVEVLRFRLVQAEEGAEKIAQDGEAEAQWTCYMPLFVYFAAEKLDAFR